MHSGADAVGAGTGTPGSRPACGGGRDPSRSYSGGLPALRRRGPHPDSDADPNATPTPTPPGPVGLNVYDMYGVQKTYQWAVNKYGVRVEQRSGQGYHCVELREITGPASLDVGVFQANGLAAFNVPVEFHWPGDMAVAYTESSGKAGFGYGPGS